MKIRKDFVTNSSSSSFVIAYKSTEDFDKVMSAISTRRFGSYCCEESGDADYISTISELEEWFSHGTGGDLFEDEHDTYKLLESYIDDGFKIVSQDLDHEDPRTDIYLNMADSFGSDFVIVYGDF